MSDRLAYDPAVSQEVQTTLYQVSNDVENLISQRGVDVAAAMEHIEAGESTTTYTDKELQWAAAADEVRGIIKSVEKTLEKYDGIANETQSNAKNVIHNI